MHTGMHASGLVAGRTETQLDCSFFRGPQFSGVGGIWYFSPALNPNPSTMAYLAKFDPTFNDWRTPNTTMSTPTDVGPGDIVAYRGGWFRVRRATRSWVNLSSPFGKAILHRSVPRSEVREDRAAWYQRWQESESYQSM